MSYQKKLNQYNKRLTKGLIKDLINKFSILNGVNYFSSGIFQNYSVFIPAKKYVKYFSGTSQINLWKFNEISDENIENRTKSDCNFAPTFVNHHVLPDIILMDTVSYIIIFLPQKK